MTKNKPIVTFKGYKLQKSSNKNKKFDVLFPEGKKVSFGHVDYADYTIHKDKDRKERYLKRAKAIKGSGFLRPADNPSSPNFWAINVLWNKVSLIESFKDAVRRLD